MRVISQDEKLDVSYELSQLFVEDIGKIMTEHLICVLEGYNCVITAKVSGGRWETFGQFRSETDALREMRRIRRAYEAGAKYYIIGTGDHDGPMEVGK